MTKEDVISFLGSGQKLAELIGVTHGAISQWPSNLSRAKKDQILGAMRRKGIAHPEEWLKAN